MKTDLTCCMCGQPATVGYCRTHDDENGIEWDSAVDDAKRMKLENERLRTFAIGQIRAYLDTDEPERDGLARGAYFAQRSTAISAYRELIGDRLAHPTREELESVVPRTKFTVREEDDQKPESEIQYVKADPIKFIANWSKTREGNVISALMSAFECDAERARGWLDQWIQLGGMLLDPEGEAE